MFDIRSESVSTAQNGSQQSLIAPGNVRLYSDKPNRVEQLVSTFNYPRKQLDEAAQKPLRLVPIRLDLEIDDLKIRDTFTWNLTESLMTPEQFAQILVDDIHDFPQQLMPTICAQIAESIRRQCESWRLSVHDNEDECNIQPAVAAQEELDMRVAVKLDLQLGPLHVEDQIEWPVRPLNEISTGIDGKTPVPTPETFAKQFCSELGIGGEMISMVSHSIREQICHARQNFEDSMRLEGLAEPPIRSRDESEQWGPQAEYLSVKEIERRLQEQERANRRLRRSQRNSNYIVIKRGLDEDASQDDDGKPATRGSLRAQRSSTAAASNNNAYNLHQQHADMYRFYGNNFAINPSAASLSSRRNLFPNAIANTTKIPYVSTKMSDDQQEVIKKLAQTARIEQLPDAKSPPKRHRGFGASANRFNEDGSMEVGEFRAKWRCAWCLLSGKFTPTLRKGPLGSKTLCNACGIWYSQKGNLPKERYHEHANDS